MIIAGPIGALAEKVGHQLARVFTGLPDLTGDLRVIMAGGRSVPVMVEALTHMKWSGVLRVFPADERIGAGVERNSPLIEAELHRQIAGSVEVEHFPGYLPPGEAMERFSERFRRLGIPLHLAFLSVGEDGHVGSLFSHRIMHLDAAPGVIIHERNSPKPPPERVSFSLQTFMDAKCVLLFFMGVSKQPQLSQFLRGEARLPLASFYGHPTVLVVTDAPLEGTDIHEV
ncbi:6-phosphogluconolactonase [Myxococcota bacterium]|nr:6-phosphogluconolactonase [Myxococcota bacterium]MBU1536569.1 6-phosphogluconolactonase [Myxococcota bacterium]